MVGHGEESLLTTIFARNCRTAAEGEELLSAECKNDSVTIYLGLYISLLLLPWDLGALWLFHSKCRLQPLKQQQRLVAEHGWWCFRSGQCGKVLLLSPHQCSCHSCQGLEQVLLGLETRTGRGLGESS